MVLAAGAVLLGAPALAMLGREPQAVMVSVSLVRGFGFGLCGVVTGALTAKLLPAERRGEGLGLLGIVVRRPGDSRVAGRCLARRTPPGCRGRRDGGHHRPAAADGDQLAAGRARGTAYRPGRVDAGRPRLRVDSGRCAAAAADLRHRHRRGRVLDSFLPMAKGMPSNLSSAALLVQAITATLSRWQAGKRGDRYGHARLLIPALAVAALGMAAMMVLGSPVMIFAGMALFGAGFGVIENATFALLIEQLPEAKASALWNLAYDAGYGAGPAVFGLICARTGYPAAFGLTSALILAALPAALRERKSGVAVVLRAQGPCLSTVMPDSVDIQWNGQALHVAQYAASV